MPVLRLPLFSFGFLLLYLCPSDEGHGPSAGVVHIGAEGDIAIILGGRLFDGPQYCIGLVCAVFHVGEEVHAARGRTTLGAP